jgi:hypothetical protein
LKNLANSGGNGFSKMRSGFLKKNEMPEAGIFR